MINLNIRNAVILFIVIQIVLFAILLPKRASTGELGTDDPDYIEPMFMRIKHLQMDLEAAGFDPGPIDGVYGKQTDDAWNTYEKKYME